MRKHLRRAVLTMCALAVLLAVAASTEARGRRSSFVMTPYGPIPRSVMYANNMSPQQRMASQKAEQAEYERYLKARNPQAYKQYMDQKKAQQSGNSSNSKKK